MIISKNFINDIIVKISLSLAIINIYAFSNYTIFSIIFMGIYIVLYLLIYGKNITFFNNVYFKWAFTFFLWGLIITMFSFNPTQSLLDIANIFLKAIFYLFLLDYIKNFKNFKYILFLIYISSIVLGIRVVALTPRNAWGTERLGMHLGLNANTVGIVMSYGVFTTLYLYKYIRQKLILSSIIPFTLIAFLTGSRKAFLMVLMIVVLFIILEIKDKRFLYKSILLGLILVLICYYAITQNDTLYQVLGKRVLSVFSSDEKDPSTITRINMIKEALHFIKLRPLIGYGFENFRIISSFNSYSHNNYTEILFSSGIIGFLIYYSLPIYYLILSFYKWLRNHTDWSFIFIIMNLTLVVDFFLVSYNYLIYQILFVVAIRYADLICKERLLND